MVDDSRYRSLLFFNTYITAANLLRADAVTLFNLQVMYEDMDLHLHELFTSKSLHAVVGLGTASSHPLWDSQHKTYAYVESVPVTVYAVDPEGTSEGTKIRWTVETELRRIVETYFSTVGSLRRFSAMEPVTIPKNGMNIYSVKYVLEYKRANDSYAPTTPSITTGGVAWAAETSTTTNAGSTTTISENVDYTGQANDHFNGYMLKFTSGTNKGRSSLITDFGVTGGVATFTCVAFPAAFTTGDTFVLSSTTRAAAMPTYIFPNVTKISKPNANNDIFQPFPGRQGSFPQSLGSDSIEVKLTCDLDMEPSALTWKRPQTTTPKTDSLNEQVFLEIMNTANTYPYQILTLPNMTFKVRLTNIEPSLDPNMNTITLTFKEYNEVSASATTATRWGIS